MNRRSIELHENSLMLDSWVPENFLLYMSQIGADYVLSPPPAITVRKSTAAAMEFVIWYNINGLTVYKHESSSYLILLYDDLTEVAYES